MSAAIKFWLLVIGIIAGYYIYEYNIIYKVGVLFYNIGMFFYNIGMKPVLIGFGIVYIFLS